MHYKGLIDGAFYAYQDFQMELLEGITFILDKERDYNQGIDDVKNSIRENIINYNIDLTNFLEFFQKHNIQLPDARSADDFKLVVNNSILISGNLSNLKDENKRIIDDFKDKKDRLGELYQSHVESMNQILDEKISEKQKKLLNLISASTTDLEKEFIDFSSNNNDFINYKKGYLDYLNKKIIEHLENSPDYVRFLDISKDILISKVNSINTVHNKSANDLKDYINSNNNNENDDDHPFSISCPISLESYLDMIRDGDEDNIVEYNPYGIDDFLFSMGRDSYEGLVVRARGGVAKCPITRAEIPYVEKNIQLVEILKLVDESGVYNSSRDTNISDDDYIKELETKILKSYVSNSKRSNILEPVNLDAMNEEDRNDDIQNIKKVLNALNKHSFFMDKSIFGKLYYGCSYFASCLRVSLLNFEINKINNPNAKNKLKSVIKSRGVFDCVKPFSSFLTFDWNNGGFLSISKSAKNISDKYGENNNDTDKNQFVSDFLKADLS